MSIENSNGMAGERGLQPNEMGRAALVPYAYVSDSADVVDLAMGLWKGRWWFCAVFLVCLAAGIIVGVFDNVRYGYSAVVQGGTLTALDDHKPFVTGQALAGRLQQIDIPRVLGAAAAKGNETAKHMRVGVNVAQGAQYVTLSVEGGSSSAPQITDLLEEIARSASVGINKKIRLYVQNKRNYLKQQIAATQATIGRLEKQAADLSHSGAEGASAATLVAIEISRLSDEIASYREQLEVDLPSNVEEAGLVSGVTRSAKPVTLGWQIWTGIGAVCGVVLGLLAAAFTRLVAGVRRRLPASG